MSALDDDSSALMRYRQAALVGAGPGGAANLAPLAWLAARGRFSRAPAPELHAGALWPDDARAIVPEAARPPLRALLTGRDARADGPYARRIADELRRRALRPHPFDLKVLESFVGRHAGKLGRHAQAWLEIVRPTQSEIREPYAEEIDAMSEASFAVATRAQKLAFLRRLRADDPRAARVLVEARLAGETASVRAGMVGVLEAGLCAEDATLLGRLGEDRAASVREAATALLARVPGSEAYAARQRDAAGWIEVKTSGLLRRTRVLQLRKPAGLAVERLEATVAAAFEGVALADMAAPLDLSPEEFCRAARGDRLLARLALARAIREDRPDLAAILTEGAGPEDGTAEDSVAVLAAALPSLATGRRAAMVEATLHPARWASLPARASLEALQQALEAPLPETVAASLLRCPAWTAAIARWQGDDERNAPDLIEAVAALTPKAMASELLATLAPLPAGLRRRPRLLFECLAALSPGAER